MHRSAPNPATTAAGTRSSVGGQVAPESVAEDRPAPAPAMDAPGSAAALGRRILSTAFVMIGPDGQLTVDLHDGRTLILRDVVMRPKDYCGTAVSEPVSSTHYCGRYADVAAARPGGGPVPMPVEPNSPGAALPMSEHTHSPG